MEEGSYSNDETIDAIYNALESSLDFRRIYYAIETDIGVCLDPLQHVRHLNILCHSVIRCIDNEQCNFFVCIMCVEFQLIFC